MLRQYMHSTHRTYSGVTADLIPQGSNLGQIRYASYSNPTLTYLIQVAHNAIGLSTSQSEPHPPEQVLWARYYIDYEPCKSN